MTFIRKNNEPEKFWNKLVRDNVPHTCHMQGLITVTRGLGDKEYLRELGKKLIEELKEYREAEGLDKKTEELADVLEVIYTLRKVAGETKRFIKSLQFVNKERESLGLTTGVLEAARKKKLQERGGFEDRIFLISTKGA